MISDVAFYLPGEADLAALAALRPDRDWRAFVEGDRAWILRTFLELARAGQPVRLAGDAGGCDVIVFHTKHRRELYRRRRSLQRPVLVGVLGDLGAPLYADVQVVQNGSSADGRRTVFIAHWPQPGLMPRDPTRGTRVEALGFKGFVGNLHPGLRSAAWLDFVSSHHLEWRCDAVEFREGGCDTDALAWPDFATIDVIVALRPPDRHLHLNKPASKLCNAWAAGVPAILGPEYAYRELRRSELDYLEVSSAAEARAAVLKLRDNPELYAAMVDNGRRRAVEFTVEATTECWRRLLFEHVPRLAADHAFQRWHRLSLGRRIALARLRGLLPRWRAS